MAAIVEAIGLGALGLSMIPLAQDFFPAPYKATTIVRVAAGMSMPGDSGASTGGHTCGIGLFDGDGLRIGFKSGIRAGSISDGTYMDIKVDPLDNNNNRPPEYLSIVGGGSDSLCVAYLAVTPPSSEYWAFYGDIPKQCGAYWYHSNLEVQVQQGSYYPACFWLTSPDPTTGKKPHPFPQGYGIHITDFTPSQDRATQYNTYPDTMCKSDPRYKAYDSVTEMNCLPVFNPPLIYGSNSVDPDFNALKTPGSFMCDPHADGTTMPSPEQVRQLEQWTGGRFNEPTYGVKRSEAPKKRQVKTRQSNLQNQACVDNHVVISSLDQHTATELCQSAASIGPDFVSTKENLYCDMCKHELWPVCSTTITAACFDLSSNTVRAGMGVQGRDESSGREVPSKSYNKVTNW
ncbi:hypothetical protein G7Y89_g15292 [Cudoniella acicularis]|uniref:Uncharacterized protein n=1 Tax=Cudoniella acicularis TaxID=354080 RepID=A0A8H4VMP5_9HELO|nr:hypothetical protein G7Y89_g15292 [Cudoniella acicularis]